MRTFSLLSIFISATLAAGNANFVLSKLKNVGHFSSLQSSSSDSCFSSWFNGNSCAYADTLESCLSSSNCYWCGVSSNTQAQNCTGSNASPSVCSCVNVPTPANATQDGICLRKGIASCSVSVPASSPVSKGQQCSLAETVNLVENMCPTGFTKDNGLRCKDVKTPSKNCPKIKKTCTRNSAGDDLSNTDDFPFDDTTTIASEKTACEAIVKEYNALSSDEKKAAKDEFAKAAKEACPKNPPSFSIPSCSIISASQLCSDGSGIYGSRISTSDESDFSTSLIDPIACTTDADCLDTLPCYSTCLNCNEATVCDGLVASGELANKTATRCAKATAVGLSFSAFVMMVAMVAFAAVF